MLIKDIKPYISEEAHKLLDEYEKTIEQHMEVCNWDYSIFKILYRVFNKDVYAMVNAFASIDSYASETHDQTKLSNEEFEALVDFSSRNPYEGNDKDEISKFIQSMKKLNIDNDYELIPAFSKYYDSLVMSDETQVSELKELISKYRKEKSEAFKKGIFDLDKSKTYAEVVKYLVISNDRAFGYKQSQIELIEEALSKEDFRQKKVYESELIYLLRKYNYDAEYILSNMPDINLVKADFEATMGKSFTPRCIALLKSYLAGDKELSQYPENLGYYEVHKVGQVPVPYSKSEYIESVGKNHIRQVSK